MTEQEKQEIILAVLGGLKVHSMTIGQLTESTTVGDSDYIELNGGRKISFKKFSELVLGQIAENIRMKANLNTQNALATGEEQRLVIRIIEKSERPVILMQGVYYNENSQLIETYALRDMHGSPVLRMVLSEEPSKNVVYCDEDTNTLLRWDGSEMVEVGGGGGGDVGDAYTKAESDKRFAKLSNTHQVISLGYALFGNEEYEVRVDGEGIMWVNGERVVTTDDETQHVFAELVKAVTVKAEEVWLGDNEDVLTTVDGKLKLNGERVAMVSDIPSGGGDWEEIYNEVHPANTAISLNFGDVATFKRMILTLHTTYASGVSGLVFFRIGNKCSGNINTNVYADTFIDFNSESLKFPTILHATTNNAQEGGGYSFHAPSGECDGSEEYTFTATNTNFKNDVTIKAYAIRR